MTDHAFLTSVPDPEGLARMAVAVGGGEVTDVERLGGGVDCATSRLRLGGRDLVLKRRRPGAAGVLAEHDNLVLAMAVAVSSPEPIAVDTEGDWFGTEALLMTSVGGRPRSLPGDRRRWIDSMVAALAAIHETPAPPGRDRLHRVVVSPASRQRQPSPLDDRIDEATARLRAVVDDRDLVFCHGDYHPGNVLFDGDDAVSVVDWNSACAGPRTLDVAALRTDLAILLGLDAADEALAAYERLVGPLADVDLWDAVWGARALAWGSWWLPAFVDAGVDTSSEQIEIAATAYVSRALHRLGI